MKTTVSMSSTSIHAGIGPDVKCGSGNPPFIDWLSNPRKPTTPVPSTFVREKDTPKFISTISKGNKESFLEGPVMQGGSPNSRCSPDESPHKAFKVLLGGFLISEEHLRPALHLGGFVLG